MDYTEAVEFLDRHIELGWKPGLERMERFTELMGSPHLEYPIIHVTGTNGKTTVARTASAILTALGLKVGTYTSPHLQRVEERFEVAGEVASPDAFRSGHRGHCALRRRPRSRDRGEGNLF